MVNASYGRFIDDKVELKSWDLNVMSVCLKANIMRREYEMARTSGYEYYYEDKGKITILRRPLLREKAIARLKYLIRLNKKKLVGYRRMCALA